MKSRRPWSAHCASSKIITTGSVSERRSKNSRHPAKSSSRPSPGSPMPRSAPSRGAMNSRSAGSTTKRSKPSASLRAVSSCEAFSAMSRRWDTISTSAQ